MIIILSLPIDREERIVVNHVNRIRIFDLVFSGR